MGIWYSDSNNSYKWIICIIESYGGLDESVCIEFIKFSYK